jgi:hypothetical protein
MHDCFTTGEGTSCSLWVAEVAYDARHLVRLVVARGNEIEDPRFVASAEKLIDDVGADEPGSPGYEDAHVAGGKWRGVTMRS